MMPRVNRGWKIKSANERNRRLKLMTNSLAVYESGGFEIMQRAAVAMVKSGYFKDSRDEAQAIVKVMAGAELGIAPFASMTGIHIVQGKPTLSSNLVATLVKNDHRYNYRVKVADNTQCILSWFEDGQPCGESSFTIEEATNASLTNKATWKSYASDMLFARALTRGARRFAPGIFGGAPVYTPEEVGADITPEGDIVVIDVQPEPEPEPEPTPGNYTDSFLQYCVDNIERYENIFAVRNALKKEYPVETGDKKEMMVRFEWLKDHAIERDADEAEALESKPLFDDQNGAYAE